MSAGYTQNEFFVKGPLIHEKCASLCKTQELFEKMNDANLVSWSVMIT